MKSQLMVSGETVKRNFSTMRPDRNMFYITLTVACTESLGIRCDPYLSNVEKWTIFPGGIQCSIYKVD